MAIIYTYPIVTPELRDLVVITDASDKNFTKQASIQEIIDLFYFDCSKCDYCTTSITKITPSAGDVVEAIECDTGVNFTSSDASVTITGNNTTKTIDFKASGSGCPTTYVVKPVTCDTDTDECETTSKSFYWVYTCDETLGALAPGYINNFKITGVEPYHPGAALGESCWWIEEVSYSATAATCEECCCELEGVYSYLRCECPAGEWPAWSVGGTLIPAEIFLEPGGQAWELCDTVDVKVGPGGDHWCYTKGDEVCESKDDYAVYDDCVDCGEPRTCECEPTVTTYTWEQCDGAGEFTVATPGGIPIGQTVEKCCSSDSGTTWECWEYMGPLGKPIGGVEPLCPEESFENCDCCKNKCVFAYTACPGDRPKIMPLTINYEMDRVDGTCDCQDALSSPVFNIGGYEWCYTLVENTCADPTADVTFVTEAPCGNELYCPLTTYEFQNCSDAGDIVRIDEEPDYAVGTILKYCCAVDDVTTIYCYEYMGPGTLPLEGALPEDCEFMNMGTKTDCSCCENYCHYEYTRCPGDAPKGMPPTIVIDLKYLYPECECNNAPGNIGVTLDATDEKWCYEANDTTCDDRTLDISYTVIGDCVDDSYCPPVTYYSYQYCGVDTIYYTSDTLDSWISSIAVLPFTGYLQADDCAEPQCCITLTGYDGVPPKLNAISDSCTVSTLTSMDNCDCCLNRNVAKYSPCASGGDACTANPDYLFDTCEAFGVLIGDPAVPDFIKFETGPDVYCCYEKVDNTKCEPKSPSTPPFTYPFADCDCGVVVYQWKACEDKDWTYTDTQDLSPYAGGVVEVASICYESQIAPSIPPGAPEGDMPEPGVGEGFVFDDCECCGNKRIKYILCDSQPDGCGISGSSYVVISDTYGGVGSAPPNIQISGDDFDCCYAKDDYTCEPVDTVTYTEHATCECLTYYRYRECGQDMWNYTETDLESWVGISYSSDEKCWEIEVTGLGGPPWGGAALLVDNYDDCDCCEYRCTVEYTKCEKATLDGCPSMPPTLVYDTKCDSGVAWPWNAPAYAVFEDASGNSCCYQLLAEPPCKEETPDYTLTTIIETDCADPECNAQWLYTSCTGCETLVSDSQFHADGTTAFWYNCCWYEVPAGPVVSALPETVPDVGQVYQRSSPCDSLSSNINILFRNCQDDSREIIWNCSCDIGEDYGIGTTINGLTGFDTLGNPVVSSDCWEAIEPSALGLSDITCEEPTVVKCGLDPCL